MIARVKHVPNLQAKKKSYISVAFAIWIWFEIFGEICSQFTHFHNSLSIFPSSHIHFISPIFQTHQNRNKIKFRLQKKIALKPKKSKAMTAIAVNQFAQSITCHAWGPDHSSTLLLLFLFLSFLLCLFPEIFFFFLSGKIVTRLMDQVNFVVRGKVLVF